MKNLEQRVTEAQTALEATEDNTPQRAAAQARLDALTEAQGFHQSEINRVAGNTRGEGRSAREQEIADELGVSIEDAKQIIEAHQLMEAENETELDKKNRELEGKNDALAQAKREAEDARKLANRRLIASELKVALINAGARADRISRLVKDADVSGVEIGEGVGGDEVKNLEAVVAAAKEETPEWFGTDYEGVPETPTGSGDRQDAPGSYAEKWAEKERKKWRGRAA